MQSCDRAITLSWLWLLASVALVSLPSATTAQVVPDATLGNGNNSVTSVTGNRTDILGGLRRNSALFHSFQEFNVLTNQQVYFANPTGIRNIFSRVTGGNLSNIDGLLGVAGGANLFLMNPSGIIFGPNARLDVSGSFLATTANVLEFADGQKFAATGDRQVPLVEVNIPIGLQMAADAPAMLRNEGNLAVGAGQNLSLIGGTTTSSGSLTASGGTVQVLGNQVGLVDQARIDVSSPTGGGTVLVGGDYLGQGSLLNAQQTFVGSGVSMNADATTQGNGGKVIVWADNATRFYGNISARGGVLGGNGGFVETSGRQYLEALGNVDAGAFNGAAGTWLLDPNNITIQATGTNTNVSASPNFSSTNDNAIVTTGSIEAALNGGTSVTITTAAAGTNAQLGDITVASAISKTAGGDASLTLNAVRDVVINAPIASTSAGNQLNVNLNAGRDTTLNSTITTNGGTLTGTASNVNVFPGGRIQNGVDAAASGATVTVNTGTYIENVTIGKNLNVASAGGVIDLTGSLIVNNPIGISGSLRSTGSQAYNSTVTLNGPTSLQTTTSTLALGQITGNGQDLTLTVNNAAASPFNISQITGVRNFATSGSGTTTLGGTFSTTGSQTYGTPLNLNADTTFNAGGSVEFNSSVNATAGNVTVSGNQITVAGTASITTDNNRTISLTGQSVTISGGQLIAPGPGGNISIAASNRTILSGNGRLEASGGSIAESAIPLVRDSNFFVSPSITLPPNTVVAGGFNYSFANIRIFNLGEQPGGLTQLTSTLFFEPTQTLWVAASALTAVPPAQPVSVNATNNLTIASTNPVVLNFAQGNGTINFDAGNSFSMRSVDRIVTNGRNINIGSTGVGTLNPTNTINIGNITPNPGINNIDASLPTGTGGIGGVIVLNAIDNINLTNSRISSDASGTADGGGIFLNGGAGTITAINSSLSSTTSGSGQSGLVNLNANNIVFRDSSRISTSVTGTATGIGGNIVASATSIELSNSSFEAVTAFNGPLTSSSTGRGGDIDINADILNLNSTGSATSGLFATTSGTADAGRLQLQDRNSDSLTVNFTGGATISASTSGSGTGGSISIPVPQRVSLLGNGSLRAGTSGSGNAGEVSISTAILDVDTATLSTDTTSIIAGAGQSGTITLRPNTGGSTLQVNLANDAQITASTSGAGVGGNLDLAGSRVTISGKGVLQAGTSGNGVAGSIALRTPILDLSGATISTAAEAGATALAPNLDPGGRITIQPLDATLTPNLAVNLSDNAVITASTAGPRQGGSISVTAPQSITLAGNGSLRAETSGSGNAGEVRLTTPNLTIQDGVRVSTSTTADGRGGSILAGAASSTSPDGLTFADSVSLRNSSLNAQTSGVGRGGSIDVRARAISLTEDSLLNAEVRAGGEGGSINLSTQSGSLFLDNSQLSTAVTSGSGQGGGITIATGSLDLANGARVISNAIGPGNAGNVQIDFDSSFTAAGRNSLGEFSGVLASSEISTSGKGGDIKINEGNPQGQLTLSNNAFLAANTRSSNDGGNIEVNVNRLELRQGGQILTAALESSSGTAGNIRINAGEVSIADRVQAPPDPPSPFTGLNVIPLAALNNQTALSPAGGGFAYYSFNIADADSQGTFNIDGGYKSAGGAASIDTQLFLFNGATGRLLAENDDTSPAAGTDPGSERLLFFPSLTRDSLINYTFPRAGNYVIGVGAFPASVSTTAPITGTAPTAIQTYTLNVALERPGTATAVIDRNPNIINDGFISSGLYASSSGSGGAGSITVDTPTLTLNNQGTISASNISSASTSNNITLRGLNDLTVLGNSEITASTSIGTAGNIRINEGTNPAASVQVQNSRIAAEATGIGNHPNSRAGNVTINAQTLSLSDQAEIVARNISSATPESDRGNFGNIQLNELNSLQVTGNSTISTSTGSGVAGNVSITANQGMNPIVNLDNSTIEATAATDGRAGDIEVNTPTVVVNNGAKISASNINSSIGGSVTFQNLNTLQVSGANSTIESTTDNGAAGDVNVAAATAVLLSDGGSLSVEATGAGNAGIVNVTTPVLSLLNGGTIRATTNSGGSTDTGNVILRGLNTLQANNGTISASTVTGIAGNVQINAPGGTVDLSNNSRVAVEATGQGGTAGNVNLTTRNLQVNQSEITVSSRQGQAGAISITANRIDMKRGKLQAQIGANPVAGSPAGSITLNVNFRITLEDESEISTLGTNGANGGNISILNARFLQGIRPTGPNGSDIIGRADGGGQGGRVILDRTLLTQGFRFRRATPGNRTNDVDTNGQLDNFSTDAGQGIRGLSTPVVVFNDVSQLVTSACEAVGAKTSTSSELRIAGQGGIAASPTAPLAAQASTNDWVSLELSPQVPVGVTFSDGTTVTMEPGETYEIQAACVNAWKAQQRPL